VNGILKRTRWVNAEKPLILRPAQDERLFSVLTAAFSVIFNSTPECLASSGAWGDVFMTVRMNGTMAVFPTTGFAQPEAMRRGDAAAVSRLANSQSAHPSTRSGRMD